MGDVIPIKGKRGRKVYRLVKRKPEAIPPMSLTQAVVFNAQRVGLDGKGTDGLHGYLRMLAEDYPAEYAKLLIKCIPALKL